MSRSLRILWVACLLLAAPAVAAQLEVEVTDIGAVNVDVGGVRCLDSFHVILPWPDWQGAAGPTDCSRQTLAPGRVRVTGVMSDGEPCATFVVDAQEGPAGLDLAWELTFTRDYETETVRLNGLLPCALSAGQAAWARAGAPFATGALTGSVGCCQATEGCCSSR